LCVGAGEVRSSVDRLISGNNCNRRRNLFPIRPCFYSGVARSATFWKRSAAGSYSAYEKDIQMSTNRSGHLSADVSTAGDPLPFRVTHGLYFHDRPGIHCIEADNGKGTAFYVYLPVGIQSGSFSLGLSERSPMVIHVTGNSEAELYRGALDLTVGGDAQFAGSFSGIDADGLEVTNGRFRLEHDASA
jgi:hypothetical protein